MDLVNEITKEVDNKLATINTNDVSVANAIEIQNDMISVQDQKSFLETTLGKVLNVGVDIGLRTVLPDFIEDTVIDVKDAILKSGFKDGLKSVVNNVIEMGKSIKGIVTGDFDSINQARLAVKKGGIIDSTSELLDYSINIAKNKGLINNEVAGILKNGKKSMINSIESSIDHEFNSEINELSKLEKYENQWKEYYSNKNFNGMEKEYNKMKKSLKEILPIESIINNARKIENLHLLIKNNGQNFDISEEQIELANMLV